MKRILVVGMSPYRGGMESYIMNIYRRIVKRGYQFDFYLHHNDPETAYEKEIIALGGKLYRNAYGRTENLFLHYANMKKVLSDPKIVGVYINTCVMVDIGLLKMAKKLGKPIRIIHSHNGGYMSELSKVEKILEWINKRKVKKYATKFLACSELAGKWMFAPNVNFGIVHNGIETNDFKFDAEVRAKVRQDLNVENKFVVGVVGRIQYQKNPEFIVELFDEIHKRKNEAVLIWAGDGDDDQVYEVKENVNKRGLKDCVKLLGMVKNTNELYQAMDVFMLPSRFEGLPFVLVEAQCAGLPCWTATTVSKEANITGNVEYLQLEDGASEWARRILEYIKMNGDRINCANVLMENGYGIDETVDRIEEYLSF